MRTLIYPVPNPALPFLGVHLSRHIDDQVTIGPTALMAAARDPRQKASMRDLAAALGWPGTWRMARRWWRTGLTEIRHAVFPRTLLHDAQRYVPELKVEDIEPGHSGVRAQALARDGRLIDDFVFSRHRPRAARAQRALAGGHRVPGHRAPDRGPGGEGRAGTGLDSPP